MNKKPDQKKTLRELTSDETRQVSAGALDSNPYA